MQGTTDKLLVFGLCLLTLHFTPPSLEIVLALLAASAVAALCEYFENRIPPYLCAAYVVLCVFFPGFVVFLPLVAYDLAGFGKMF